MTRPDYRRKTTNAYGETATFRGACCVCNTRTYSNTPDLDHDYNPIVAKDYDMPAYLPDVPFCTMCANAHRLYLTGLIAAGIFWLTKANADDKPALLAWIEANRKQRSSLPIR